MVSSQTQEGILDLGCRTWQFAIKIVHYRLVLRTDQTLCVSRGPEALFLTVWGLGDKYPHTLFNSCVNLCVLVFNYINAVMDREVELPRSQLAMSGYQLHTALPPRHPDTSWC